MACYLVGNSKGAKECSNGMLLLKERRKLLLYGMLWLTYIKVASKGAKEAAPIWHVASKGAKEAAPIWHVTSKGTKEAAPIWHVTWLATVGKGTKEAAPIWHVMLTSQSFKRSEGSCSYMACYF